MTPFCALAVPEVHRQQVEQRRLDHDITRILAAPSVSQDDKRELLARTVEQHERLRQAVQEAAATCPPPVVRVRRR